jgi:hypothetical protein
VRWQHYLMMMMMMMNKNADIITEKTLKVSFTKSHNIPEDYYIGLNPLDQGIFVKQDVSGVGSTLS